MTTTELTEEELKVICAALSKYMRDLRLICKTFNPNRIDYTSIRNEIALASKTDIKVFTEVKRRAREEDQKDDLLDT